MALSSDPFALAKLPQAGDNVGCGHEDSDAVEDFLVSA